MKVEDIKVGQHVTIKQWFPRGGRTDRSWCGDVLEIRAINYPYIVCLQKRMTTFSYAVHASSITLSLEEVELMPLSDEYVNEALGIVLEKEGEANDK